MPCIGLPSFLQETEETEETEEDVSMPCIGLFPFLRPSCYSLLYWHPLCVNALYRAFPISTEEKSLDEIVAYLCQCPVSGFSHFYG